MLRLKVSIAYFKVDPLLPNIGCTIDIAIFLPVGFGYFNELGV